MTWFIAQHRPVDNSTVLPRQITIIELTSGFSFQTLVEHNKLSGRIQVIPGRVEEVHVPEQVDIIISEPMGYMLYNERMLETYIHARVS